MNKAVEMQRNKQHGLDEIKIHLTFRGFSGQKMSANDEGQFQCKQTAHSKPLSKCDMRFHKNKQSDNNLQFDHQLDPKDDNK